MQIYKTQIIDIPIRYDGDPLIPFGLSYSDISDIVISLKVNPDIEPNNKYLQKRLSTGGVTLDTQTNTITLKLNQTDYQHIVTDKTYEIVVGALVANQTELLTLGSENQKVKILPSQLNSIEYTPAEPEIMGQTIKEVFVITDQTELYLSQVPKIGTIHQVIVTGVTLLEGQDNDYQLLGNKLTFSLDLEPDDIVQIIYTY